MVSQSPASEFLEAKPNEQLYRISSVRLGAVPRPPDGEAV